jgi:hypothetical protein
MVRIGRVDFVPFHPRAEELRLEGDTVFRLAGANAETAANALFDVD